jgi:hypothetical protein
VQHQQQQPPPPKADQLTRDLIAAGLSLYQLVAIRGQLSAGRALTLAARDVADYGSDLWERLTDQARDLHDTAESVIAAEYLRVGLATA